MCATLQIYPWDCCSWTMTEGDHFSKRPLLTFALLNCSSLLWIAIVSGIEPTVKAKFIPLHLPFLRLPREHKSSKARRRRLFALAPLKHCFRRRQTKEGERKKKSFLSKLPHRHNNKKRDEEGGGAAGDRLPSFPFLPPFHSFAALFRALQQLSW